MLCRSSFKCFIFGFLFLFSFPLLAEDSSYKRLPSGELDFYSVLDGLLHRFTEDLNQLDQNVQKTAQYRVNLVGSLPEDFKETLRGRIDEVVTNKSKVKMVKCLSCFKTLVTTEEDSLIVRQGVQKSGELQTIARDIGVRLFLESSLNYQPTEMVFSASLFDAFRGEIIWSRSYSSRDPEKKEEPPKLEEKAKLDKPVKRTTYQMNISPGFFLLPGASHSLVNYPGISVSLLELMGGFWSHFGIALSGFANPIAKATRDSGKALIDGGGIFELRLYGDLGGEKFKKHGWIGGGPLFSGNFQSFLAGGGMHMDIGKKFGFLGALFYIFPSDLMQNEDKVQISGGNVVLSSDQRFIKHQGLGANLAFNLRW